MIPILVFFVATVVSYLGLRVLQSRQSAARQEETAKDPNREGFFRHQDEAWSVAEQVADSSSKPLVRMARPLSQIEALQKTSAGPIGVKIGNLLLTSGGRLYGGSPEVFLAVQALCVVLGFWVLVIASTASSSFNQMILGSLALIVAIYPFQDLKSKVKKRQEQVLAQLPDFAELLLIPLTSGHGVKESLEDTASRIDGPVSDVVKRLVRRLGKADATLTVAAKYRLAGEELGTQEGRAFFSAIARTDVEGVRASDIIAEQASVLRDTLHQHQRAQLSKLPSKLILVMGVFLLIFILVLIMIPVLISFSRTGF